MDIPRPSVYRLIEAYKAAELVKESDDGPGFRLSPRLIHLGRAAQSSIPLVRAARPMLEELTVLTGLTAFVCRNRGLHIECLDRTDGPVVAPLALAPGTTLPSHAGAASRVLLALSDELMAATLKQESLSSLTPQTLTSAEDLLKDARQTRSQRYSLSDEDVTIGVAAIGTAIFTDKGNLCGAVSLAGRREDVVPRAHTLVPTLKDAAERIAHELNAAG